MNQNNKLYIRLQFKIKNDFRVDQDSKQKMITFKNTNFTEKSKCDAIFTKFIKEYFVSLNSLLNKIKHLMFVVQFNFDTEYVERIKHLFKYIKTEFELNAIPLKNGNKIVTDTIDDVKSGEIKLIVSSVGNDECYQGPKKLYCCPKYG